jgi:hypothetical protein
VAVFVDMSVSTRALVAFVRGMDGMYMIGILGCASVKPSGRLSWKWWAWTFWGMRAAGMQGALVGWSGGEFGSVRDAQFCSASEARSIFEMCNL